MKLYIYNIEPELDTRQMIKDTGSTVFDEFIAPAGVIVKNVKEETKFVVKSLVSSLSVRSARTIC